MAVSGDDVISADNLGAVVGLAASGDTGGKPISADNLLSIINGGGLVGLKTLWEGGPVHELNVTDPEFSESRLYVVDINYTISAGSNYPITCVVMFSGTHGYSWNVVPDKYSSSYQRPFTATNQKGSNVVRFTYGDNRDDAGITRVRGGVSLADLARALGGEA